MRAGVDTEHTTSACTWDHCGRVQPRAAAGPHRPGQIASGTVHAGIDKRGDTRTQARMVRVRQESYPLAELLTDLIFSEDVLVDILAHHGQVIPTASRAERGG